jgi:anti-sigma B factor antagonist
MQERRSPRPPVTLGVSRAATLDVVLEGEIDFGNSPRILEEVRTAVLRRRPALVRVDLTLVTYADSSALGMLVKLVEVAQEVSASVRVENPSPAVLRVMQITGLTNLFGLGD